MEKNWFLIVNPTSGNGAAKKKWKSIITSLKKSDIAYDYHFSDYEKHEQKIVASALKKGYRKFICLGGDGTLHHVVNGIMNQDRVKPSSVKVGIIPLGTGNDWIKTYGISKKIKKAVATIKNENSTLQDIGEIALSKTGQIVYFNNLAGIGFDGFVIKNVMRYKKLGALAYLIGALTSFIKYEKSILSISFDQQVIQAKSLLTLVGLCKFSGGGMKLTDKVDTSDGLFDISIAKNISILGVILNIMKFFNGKITKHKEVVTYKTREIKIFSDNSETFIQADGELIGQGGFNAKVIPQAIRFIIP